MFTRCQSFGVQAPYFYYCIVLLRNTPTLTLFRQKKREYTLHFAEIRSLFFIVSFGLNFSNIRNYSPEVINIQRREAELNIILLRMNNFDIKQKKAWNICFILCHKHQTRSGKIKVNKTQQILVRTQGFFRKN